MPNSDGALSVTIYRLGYGGRLGARGTDQSNRKVGLIIDDPPGPLPLVQTGGSPSLAVAATANFPDLRRGESGSIRVTGHVGSLTYTLCALLIHVTGRYCPCCHADPDLEIFTCSAECAAPSEATCQCRANVGLSPIISILCQSHIKLETLSWQGGGKIPCFPYIVYKNNQ